MSPLRYLTIFALSSLLVLTSVLVVTIWADPAHIFRTPRAYNEMARLLVTGVPVGELITPRHRLINRAFIARLGKATQTVILGSSRVQPFSPAEAEWPESLNLAVEGGGLGDYLHIYSLLRERDLIPARIVIAVDPYIFSPDRDLLARNGQQLAMRRIVSALGVVCIQQPNWWGGLSSLPELFTLDYFIESSKVLQGQLLGQAKQIHFSPDPELRSLGFIKRPDGNDQHRSENQQTGESKDGEIA